MKIVEVVLMGIKQYGTIDGETCRKDYWIYMSVFYILYLIFTFIDLLIGIFIFSTVFTILFAIPTITITIRRIHDVGKSGWLILIPIYNFILTIMPSTDRKL